MIKGAVQYLTIISIPNKSPNIHEAELAEYKVKLENSTILIGNLNAPFPIMDRPIRYKTNKEIEELNNTINKLKLTDNYRKFYLTIAEYILLKCTWKFL